MDGDLSRSSLSRSSHWLLVSHEDNAMEMFTLKLFGGEEALPIFGREEEARAFVEFGGFESSWRVRNTAAGELVSILCGPCAHAERVAPDPPPEVLTGMSEVEPVSVGREDFMARLLGEDSPQVT